MKNPIIVGNWKLNGSKNMIHEFFTILLKKMNIHTNCKIIITPPMIYLTLVKHYLNKSPIKLGAQNVDIHSSGAFTGEVSPEMLKDIGVEYVIIGHSERRIYHKENEKCIIKKFSATKNAGLKPILCIGENEKENKTNKTKETCILQINTIIDALGIKSLKNTIIAYEPIWAIGKGIFPSPTKVQEIHKHIRLYIEKKDQNISKKISIQYGGSINLKNITDFLSQDDIDGVLIGSASLCAKTFLNIIKHVEKLTSTKIKH
ncbi:Triosephosphate isomerase [Candidatus Westeberhardia cardiocondylae]|uniref:Triosephosphate isomerase n=1 Tax=Candidatus Westeberhardia cardiocondylae TaxID=1594731 RepID=A0A0H5BWS3_9ENTR|nr:triose-phosphate isomerase [Candidatus Westeberhardia cardiocondylae]CEN32123.1 Triosephosphate isomerase [Candidatus Westeberhardia cardiocondylae]